MEIIEKAVFDSPKVFEVEFDKKLYIETINNLNKRTLQYSLHVGHIFIYQKNIGIPWTSYAEVRGVILNEVYKINYHVGMIKSYRELYPVIPIHHILKDELLVICRGTNLYREIENPLMPEYGAIVDIPTIKQIYKEPVKDDQIYRFEYGLIDDMCLYIKRQGFVDNMYDKNYITNSETNLDEFKKETILKGMK